jgi:hypothetical protein
LQALPRLLAHYGEEAWKDGSWENAIPRVAQNVAARVAQNVAARVDRLRCLGNGQVPHCAAEAWTRLVARFGF